MVNLSATPVIGGRSRTAIRIAAHVVPQINVSNRKVDAIRKGPGRRTD
jgi:hypothetical protein